MSLHFGKQAHTAYVEVNLVRFIASGLEIGVNEYRSTGNTEFFILQVCFAEETDFGLAAEVFDREAGR